MVAVFLILSVLTVLVSLIYYLSTRKFNYWKNQNVPHLKPTPILGNFGEYILLKKYIGEVTQNICQIFPNEPYIGAFYGTEPTLIVQNPELIKLITTKDFYYFSGREVSNYTHNEVITQNLFFTYGDRWKLIRQNMTPLFSSAKMRNMFHLIEKNAHAFEKLLDDESKISNRFEVRSLVARFTMDCIGSCVFGIETNAMGRDDDNPFKKMGDNIFEISNVRGLSFIARAIWPAIFYGLRFKIVPKTLNDFFNKLLTGVFEERKLKAPTRNDFIDLLINLKKEDYITGESLSNKNTGSGKKVSLKVDDELMVSQCLSFFAAGFDTSATTIGFSLYELAKNKEAHDKAIEEVDAYLLRHGGKLGYECVSELPYLNACIDEALRLYPVLGTITREVTEDYTLPSGVRLEKGVRVHLPVYHLHRHPDFFPEPEQYRPERFLPQVKSNIKPYTYMPFGEGQRICIGMRFAKMQMLAGFVTILKKYELELAEDMPRTMEFEPRAFGTQAKRGVDLKLVERSGWEQRVFDQR